MEKRQENEGEGCSLEHSVDIWGRPKKGAEKVGIAHCCDKVRGSINLTYKVVQCEQENMETSGHIM